MSRRVLITGASGFIGGALARSLLGRGDTVFALTRDDDPPKGCKIIRGWLESSDDCRRAVKESRPDIVYHLAAQAFVEIGHCDPLTTFESNVRGTWNLLHELMGPTPIVVASSDKAYGELTAGRPCYDEDDPLRGRGIYDCSKSCADLIAQSFAAEYPMDIRIARLGNVYGPGDPDLSRIVPSIVDDIINARSPVIQSDGTPIRDYLYIDDAVSAYLTLGDWKRPDLFKGASAFNFSGKAPLSVLELTELSLEIAKSTDENGVWAGITCLGRTLTAIEMDPQIKGIRGRYTHEISRQVLDCHKASTILGWEPKVSLYEGLKRTLERAWRVHRDR